MALVVADTSALVSLGTVADTTDSPLDRLLATHEVVVPAQVLTELRETATREDRSGDGAQAVLDRRSKLDVRTAELDEGFPLDDGENAATSLANDLGATQLLCDEFNRLAIIHASLTDTRLVTTPPLLIALVRSGYLTPDDATTLLERLCDARSWDANSSVAQAKRTLDNAEGGE